MKIGHGVMAAALMAVACAMQAQVAVKHLQPNEKSPIANGVWAGDTLYLSGQAGFAGDAGGYGEGHGGGVWRYEDAGVQRADEDPGVC